MIIFLHFFFLFVGALSLTFGVLEKRMFYTFGGLICYVVNLVCLIQGGFFAS